MKEYVNRCATMAAKLYSLNVPMVITTIQVDESTDAEAGVPAYVVVASRKAALDIIEETNYGDRPDGDGPRIQEGDFVRAQITSVARDSIAVVVGGVDTRVPLHALTFEYLVDARTKYKVGQEIMVQVEQIIKEKDGHHIVEVNCKQPELGVRSKCAALFQSAPSCLASYLPWLRVRNSLGISMCWRISRCTIYPYS